MAKIALVNGGHAKVSDHQFDRMNKYHWWKCDKCGHIIRVVKNGAIQRTVYMACEVMGLELRVGGACNPCPIPADHESTKRRVR